MNSLKAIILGCCIAFVTVGGGCKKKKLENSKQEAKQVTPNDFLSADQYETLELEIQYVTNYKPTTDAVNFLVAFLKARLNKPGDIKVAMKEVSGLNKSSYTADDLRSFEDDNRERYPKDKALTAYIFFADKPYAGNSGNSKTLGVTYAPTSVAIFEKTIQDLSGGIGQPGRDKLEQTVLNHEFGHVMGLVNTGTPMTSQHQDAANGAHCNNKNCLMYWSVETSDVVANLLGASVPDLDAACLSDLRNNGGK